MDAQVNGQLQPVGESLGDLEGMEVLVEQTDGCEFKCLLSGEC